MAGGTVTYRAALAHPTTRRLWLATALSALGDHIATGALLLLAYDRGGQQVIYPALLFASSAVPALLSSIVAGSWLDQVRRERALALLHLGGALAVAVPILVGGLLPVFVAAGLLGMLKTATISVRSGAMAEGVPDEFRGPLLALIGTTDQGLQVVGFLTGAALTAWVGAPVALVIDAITFVVAAAVLSRLTLPAPVPRERRPPVTAGLRDIFTNPVLRLLAPLAWVTGTVAALPETLAAGATVTAPEWTPFALAAGPFGQAVTLFFLGRAKALQRPSVQMVHLAWLALALSVAALGGSPPFYVLANVLVGSGVAWLIGPQLTFLRVAPPHRMAQITGTMIAVIIVAEGLGTTFFAWIADRTSIAGAYRAAGVLVLLASLVGWLVKERTPAAVLLDAPTTTGSGVWTANRRPHDPAALAPPRAEDRALS